MGVKLLLLQQLNTEYSLIWNICVAAAWLYFFWFDWSTYTSVVRTIPTGIKHPDSAEAKEVVQDQLCFWTTKTLAELFLVRSSLQCSAMFMAYLVGLLVIQEVLERTSKDTNKWGVQTFYLIKAYHLVQFVGAIGGYTLWSEGALSFMLSPAAKVAG